MSDEPPGLEPPDPTTPDPAASAAASLRPEFADPGPFQSWPDPEPPNRLGCVLQVLIAVAIVLALGWTTMQEVKSGLFRDAVDLSDSTSTSSTSSTTSSSTTSSTTTTTLPQVEEYSLQITYAGSCEGQNSAFTLRVRDGSTIELYGGAPEMLFATSTVGPPGRSFAFDGVGGSTLTMQGSIDGDTLSGTGTWSELGPNCTFTLAGSRL